MKTIAVIPARMGSSRFPGKPLAPILGRPMIEHVFRRTRMCTSLSGVYVATCDTEIARATEAFGGQAIMTSPAHERASDRVAEAAEHIDADVILMVQGDEPMITPEMIDSALKPLREDPHVVCTNLAAPIVSEKEFVDRNTIKVVMAANGDALYFSRQPVPTRSSAGFGTFPAYKQICVIPFRAPFLRLYGGLPQTPLERAESIDMLRLLEHGYRVRLVPCECTSYSVDTQDDLRRVEASLAVDPIVASYVSQEE